MEVQCYLFKVMRLGMEGLVAFYGTELFITFSDAEVTGILEDLFDRAPREHTLATWAKVADTIDIIAIYRTLSQYVLPRGWPRDMLLVDVHYTGVVVVLDRW